MKRRLFVQGTSIRKQVLRQRRVHTALAARWFDRNDNVRPETSKKPVRRPIHE